jgi:hypothetical protein
LKRFEHGLHFVVNAMQRGAEPAWAFGLIPTGHKRDAVQ